MIYKEKKNRVVKKRKSTEKKNVRARQKKNFGQEDRFTDTRNVLIYSEHLGDSITKTNSV